MGQITHETAKTRPPDVKIFFSPGNYDHALSSYYAARDWAMATGQCFRQDIYGTINHPHHPQCRVGQYNVPEELIEEPGWSCTVDIWVADEAALAWVRGLPTLEGAQLVVLEDDGEGGG